MKRFFYGFLFILLQLFFSCENIKDKEVLKQKSIISEREAKEIVAKEIMESDYYQQFYFLSSEKYDERVNEISWGETILITVIPDGKYFTNESKYYLFTGILPDGQVLAAQTVNAYTGELMDGAVLFNENSKKLKIASLNQEKEYAERLNLPIYNVEAVFYFDGTVFSMDPIFSWKYCINLKDDRSIMNTKTNISDFVFLDPWISIDNENEKNSESIDNMNAFFAKQKINHRAYKLNITSSYRNLLSNEKIIFEPID